MASPELVECREPRDRAADVGERAVAGAGSQSLLIVEDDSTAAALLSRVLRRHRYLVQVAASVGEALELSARGALDAAVIDLKLGSESGLQLIPVLLQRHPAMRILVLTGYASVATAVQAIKLGAVDYLAKPANVADILRILGGQASARTVRTPIERPTVRRLEWEYIQRVLAEHRGNVSSTARALGMLRRTLQRKLAKRPQR